MNKELSGGQTIEPEPTLKRGWWRGEWGVTSTSTRLVTRAPWKLITPLPSTTTPTPQKSLLPGLEETQ